MYEYNGQQYTLDQVQEAANKRNMSLDDYVSEFGLTKILESSPDFQNPTMPGAIVGENKAPDTESKSVDPSGVIFVPTPTGLKIPITYGGESVDDLTGDEIFQRVVDNTMPMLKTQWEGLKAAAIDWSKNVIGEDFTDLVTKGDQGAILYIDPKTNKKISYKDNPERWVELNSEKAFNFDSSIKSVYADTGEEVGKATEKYMIDTFKKIDEESKKIQYAGSLVKGVTGAEGPSGKEFFGGALSTVQSLITSMVPALLTRGATIAPQITGSMYGDYNIEKAKTIYGDDPNALDKLVENNEAEFTVPVALGFAAAAGEYVGMKGVGKTIAKSGLKSKNAILHLWAAGGEGTTEWYQTGVEGYSQALAQGKNAGEAAGDAWNLMTSPQGIEAFVQGAFGSGMITTSSAAVKKAYISARDNGEGLGIVPKGMRDLAILKQKALETTDPDVKAGIENSILDLENKIKDSVEKGNSIVDNASESEVNVLADAQTALELYKTRVETLTSKLEAGTISQEEYDLALTGYVNEYKKSQEAAKNTISDISTKNQQASDNNKELIDVIKNTESTEQQINTAKNKLVENNQGLINNIVNKNFNPTLDTTLTKEDFAAEVNIEFAKLINSYKPETNVPFGAYVAQNLPRRLPAVFDRLVETKTNEEGKKEIIAKQDITDTQIEGEVTTQKEVELEAEKTTSIKNKLFTTKLGFDKKFVPGQTDKTFADVFSEAVAKTFGTSLPEISDKNFVKEFQKKNRAELTPIIQELTKKDKDTGVDNFKIFLDQNFDAIINQLPQSVINKKYKMLREAVLDESGKQKREGTKEGKGVFKRVEQEKDDFIDYFTNPDIGSSTRSDRKQSLLRTLIDELSADAALNVVKDKSIMDKFKTIQEVEGKKVPDNLEKAILESIDRIDGLINDFEAFLNDKDILRADFGMTNAVGRTIVLFLKGVKASLKQGLNLAQAIKANISKLNSFFKSEKLTKPEQNIVTEVINEINADGKLPTSSELKQKFRGKSKEKQIKSFNKVIIPLYKERMKGLKTEGKEGFAKDFYSSYYRTLGKLEGLNRNNITEYFKNIFGKDIKLEIKGSAVSVNGKRFKPNTVDQTKTASFVKKFKDNEKELRKNQKEQAYKSRDQLIDLLNTFREAYEKDSSTIEESFFVLNGLGNDMNSLAKKYQVLGNNQNKEALKKGQAITLEHNPPYDAILANVFLPYIEGKITKNDLITSMTSHKLELLSKAEADQINKNLKESMPEGYNYIKGDPIVRINTVRDTQTNAEKIKGLGEEFNKILEETKGIPAEQRVSQAQAKNLAPKKERIRLFVPFTADDLLGLLYKFAGQGKKGDAHLKWLKTNIMRPLTKANLEFESNQVQSNKFLEDAKKLMAKSNIDLTKEAINGYTVEQAIRIHLWNKRGYTIPGIEKQDIEMINQWLRQNFDSLEFTDAIEKAYVTNENKYPEPDENWVAGTITTDLLEFTNTVSRAQAFEPFFENINEIFGKFDKFKGKLSGPTVSKIRSIYGNTFVEALESSFYRIGTGKNRSYQLDKQGGIMLDWLNNAIGNIMFINTRSALLQTISSMNFINLKDNNPLAATKAWANQPKFWSYFNKIFFSDYLKSRRSGLRTDVNEQEIATAAANSKNPTRAVIATILKKGFMPTQMADSFAIAFGGSSFLSNREASYKKEGLSDKEAFDKAFEDMRDIAEDTQQSGRPEKISMEQAGFGGRLILAFQNTPMQYNRLIKKAILDLANRRGDWKTNVSKIVTYGLVQNALFYSLQQALFSVLFDEPENEKEEEKEKSRYVRALNGMVDSILRGSGIFGALTATTKNTIMKIVEREGFDEKGIEEIFNLSPPIGTKTRKLFDIKDKFTYKQELKKMREMGVDTENPAVLAAGDALSFGLNLPADRLLRKINNLRAAFDKENETWQKIALSLGWSKWDVGIPFESTAKPKKPKILKPQNRRKRVRKNTNSRTPIN